MITLLVLYLVSKAFVIGVLEAYLTVYAVASAVLTQNGLGC